MAQGTEVAAVGLTHWPHHVAPYSTPCPPLSDGQEGSWSLLCRKHNAVLFGRGMNLCPFHRWVKQSPGRVMGWDHRPWVLQTQLSVHHCAALFLFKQATHSAGVSISGLHMGY